MEGSLHALFSVLGGQACHACATDGHHEINSMNSMYRLFFHYNILFIMFIMIFIIMIKIKNKQ